MAQISFCSRLVKTHGHRVTKDVLKQSSRKMKSTETLKQWLYINYLK